MSGADGYTVYRKAGTDVSLSANDGTSSTSANTITIAGLTNGIQYSFVVYAKKGQELSGASIVVFATPIASVTVPAPPTGGSIFTISGGLLGDYTVTFTLTGNPAIAVPDTSGAYPTYTVPQASLPLTVSASSMPAAMNFQWLLDAAQLSSATSILTLDSLQPNIHYLTLLLKVGTDPNRSVTIILNATN